MFLSSNPRGANSGLNVGCGLSRIFPTPLRATPGVSWTTSTLRSDRQSRYFFRGHQIDDLLNAPLKSESLSLAKPPANDVPITRVRWKGETLDKKHTRYERMFTSSKASTHTWGKSMTSHMRLFTRAPSTRPLGQDHEGVHA